MNLNTLLDLAIMIFAGMFCGRMAKHVHLPNVTGYLVAGLLIGPSVFGLLSEDFLTTINIISDVALGFIAFSIGNEFKMSYFKRVGVAPIVIACLESLFAVVFVVLGLLIARQPLPFSLVLGAIAAATAPAATIMVIKQYRAKGPVTETLLSVVAIDDATALILFSLGRRRGAGPDGRRRIVRRVFAVAAARDRRCPRGGGSTRLYFPAAAALLQEGWQPPVTYCGVRVCGHRYRYPV